MTALGERCVVALVCVLSSACSGSQKSSPAVSTPSAGITQSESPAANQPATTPDSSDGLSSHRKTSPAPVPTAKSERRSITPEVLRRSPTLIGQTVAVEGRCGGYLGSVEPPPISRSDWLLIGTHESVYVVGEPPAGCSSPNGGQALVTVVGEVAADSIPSSNGYQRRIFLLRSR